MVRTWTGALSILTRPVIVHGNREAPRQDRHEVLVTTARRGGMGRLEIAVVVVAAAGVVLTAISIALGRQRISLRKKVSIRASRKTTIIVTSIAATTKMTASAQMAGGDETSTKKARRKPKEAVAVSVPASAAFSDLTD
jgi:hypothetical protein